MTIRGDILRRAIGITEGERESTYGDRARLAQSLEERRESLAAVINEARAKGGNLVIPSFALERTQEVILILEKLRNQKRIPAIPLYVDSPMAVSITDIFNKHLTSFHLAQEFKD